MKMELVKSFEAEQLFVDLDKPSLRGLSFVLRNPDTWPKGFEWNYDRCSNCAMGLSVRLWKEIKGDWIADMAIGFRMSFRAANEIFVKASNTRGWGDDRHRITPEMVADDIDAYLACLAQHGG